MKLFHYLTIVCLAAGIGLLPAQSLRAEDKTPAKGEITLTFGGSTVNGDADDFRAHQWMSDGTMFGIRDLRLEDEDAKGLWVEFDGHAINNNDVGAELEVKKEGGGFLRMEYEAFQKYYDNTGGLYYPFTIFPSVDTGNLAVDIGEFKLEVGTSEDDAKGVGLYYEHHYKDGIKSRLTWATAREGSTSKKITPSPQDVNESVDAFGLKERTEAKGFNLKGEQRLELVKIHGIRREQDYSTNAVASQKTYNLIDQEIDDKAFQAQFHGDKWFNDDNSYFSLGYMYQLLDSEELENHPYFTEFDVPTNNSHYRVNATSGVDLNSHTMTSSYLMSPTENLNIIMKVKGEVFTREGDSFYPADSNSPPDGRANTIEYNEVDNNVRRLGESVSLRYAGIPKTSSYFEYDAEQTANSLWERLTGLAGTDAAVSSGNWERDSRNHIRKDTITLGARTVPVKWFNMTNQARYRWETNDYDDVYETTSSSSSRSAFVEELKLRGPEYETKLTWKPKDWVQTSLRYQLMSQEYVTRTDGYSNSVSAHVISNTLTYDLFLQPMDPLLLNVSYSAQDLKTTTPALGGSASVATPTFNANVDSWLFSASYAAREDLSYVATFNCVTTNNFNDFTSTGLPMGADFNMYDIGLGFDWSLSKDTWTVKPRYSYYRYDPNPKAEEGAYSAHVAWVDVTYKW